MLLATKTYDVSGFWFVALLLAIGAPPAFVWLRRRRWQFTLRQLLLGVALVAVALACLRQDFANVAAFWQDVQGRLVFPRLDLLLAGFVLSAAFTWAIVGRRGTAQDSDERAGQPRNAPRDTTPLLALMPLLLATACSPVAPPAAPEDDRRDERAQQQREEVTEEISETLDETQLWAYRCSSDDEADVVVVVRFHIPGVTRRDELRFPFKRNPSGRGVDFIQPTAIGWSADGLDGCGNTGHIALSGDTESHITVELSVSGRRRDGTVAGANREVHVPWLGHAEEALPHGGRIAVRFEKAGD